MYITFFKNVDIDTALFKPAYPFIRLWHLFNEWHFLYIKHKTKKEINDINKHDMKCCLIVETVQIHRKPQMTA